MGNATHITMCHKKITRPNCGCAIAHPDRLQHSHNLVVFVHKKISRLFSHTQLNFKFCFSMAQQSSSLVALVPYRSQFNYLMSLPWTNPCILQPGPLKAWVEFQLPAENTVSSIIVVSATTHTSTSNFFISILGHCRLSGPKSHYHFHYTSRCIQVMSYMSNPFFCQNPIVLLAYLPTLSSHTHCLIKLFWQFPQLLTTCATLYLVHHHPNSLPRLLKLQVFLAIGLHLCLWLKALSKTTP